MDADLLKKAKPIERLKYWVTEREAIRVKKEAGLPPPWTTDPILSTYRFCCVRRMDDKVSRWIMTNWYEPFHGHRHMVYACGLARLVNEPNTLAPLTEHIFTGKPGTDPWWQTIASIMNARRTKGDRVFNPAYVIPTGGESNKVNGVVKIVKELPTMVGIDTTCMEATYARLMTCPYIGSFLAGQIVADLRWAVNGKWGDRMTWAPVGPGSARGLARLVYARDEWEGVAKSYTGKSVTEDGTGAWLWDFREHVLDVLPQLLPRDLAGRMEAHDYQNTLCEWDKMERTLWGEGKPKQLYKAGAA